MAQLASLQIKLHKKHLQEIIYHVEQEQPREACGVILGREQTSLEVIPISNTAATPNTTFQMSPDELLAIFYQLDEEKKELLAFYHSHPNSAPIPSPTDLTESKTPDTPMLIIGKQRGSWVPKAYTLQKNRAVPISLQIFSEL